MKKIILSILITLMLPVFSFAYTVSGSSRSYSVPSRSYSSPSPSYSAPSRSYTVTPSPTTYTVPSRTYTPPTSIPSVTARANTTVAPQVTYVYTSSPSFNPFSFNFFLWWWIFRTPSPVINNVNATTTHATSTKN